MIYNTKHTVGRNGPFHIAKRPERDYKTGRFKRLNGTHYKTAEHQHIAESAIED